MDEVKEESWHVAGEGKEQREKEKAKEKKRGEKRRRSHRTASIGAGARC